MKSETSFDLDGDLIVVDATVVGPSGKAHVRLILDTGAVPGRPFTMGLVVRSSSAGSGYFPQG